MVIQKSLIFIRFSICRFQSKINLCVCKPYWRSYQVLSHIDVSIGDNHLWYRMNFTNVYLRVEGLCIDTLSTKRLCPIRTSCRTSCQFVLPITSLQATCWKNAQYYYQFWWHSVFSKVKLLTFSSRSHVQHHIDLTSKFNIFSSRK